MLTIFSLPKAFEGHIAIIQMNALRSWKRLAPDVQVVLCGSEKGIAEVAAREGVDHLPDIARNEFGTPLISDAFEKAQEMARHPVVCYVNGDIMLLSDFRSALQKISMNSFLMIGRRYNMDFSDHLDFEDATWELKLRDRALLKASLFTISGMDYFAFPTGVEFAKLPPFAVGRPGWDNWLVEHARCSKVPVLDATPSVIVIHQNHGYRHVPLSRGTTYEGPEADQNRRLMGRYTRQFGTTDATHVVTASGVRRAWGLGYLNRRWTLLPDAMPWTRPFVSLTKAVTPTMRRILRRDAAAAAR